MTDTVISAHGETFPTIKTEVAAMRARREQLASESARLGKTDAGVHRRWAIENELENMDWRLAQLGVSLDAVL